MSMVLLLQVVLLLVFWSKFPTGSDFSNVTRNIEKEDQTLENSYDNIKNQNKILEIKLQDLKQKKEDLKKQFKQNEESQIQFKQCLTDLEEKDKIISMKESDINKIASILKTFHENIQVNEIGVVKKVSDACVTHYDEFCIWHTKNCKNTIQEFNVDYANKCVVESIQQLKSKGKQTASSQKEVMKKKYEELLEKQYLTQFALIAVSITQIMLIGIMLFWGCGCGNKKDEQNNVKVQKPKEKKKRKVRFSPMLSCQIPKSTKNNNLNLQRLSTTEIMSPISSGCDNQNVVHISQNSSITHLKKIPFPSPTISAENTQITNNSVEDTVSTTYDYGPLGDYQDFLQKRSMSHNAHIFCTPEYEEKSEQDFDTDHFIQNKSIHKQKPCTSDEN